MFNKSIIGFLVLVSFGLRAQSPKLSGPEIKWALGHPFAAFKVKKISKRCNSLFLTGSVKQKLDSFPSGGQLDAYRHVFYMAAYSQKIKVNKVRRLGKAHEKSNYRQFLKLQNEEGEVPDSLASVMDLQNNELGFAIGCNNRSLPLEELKTKVIEEIKKGKAVIFKRDKTGRYLDCENKPLPKQANKSWYQPKCLVPSNYNKRS